jgi:hypothetical protein
MGFLEAATFAQVQSEISHVFASPDYNAGVTPAQQADPAPTSAPPPRPADQPPATVEIGELRPGSRGAWPAAKNREGRREDHLFYKDLKITFTDGKVSDVQ